MFDYAIPLNSFWYFLAWNQSFLSLPESPKPLTANDWQVWTAKWAMHIVLSKNNLFAMTVCYVRYLQTLLPIKSRGDTKFYGRWIELTVPLLQLSVGLYIVLTHDNFKQIRFQHFLSQLQWHISNILIEFSANIFLFPQNKVFFIHIFVRAAYKHCDKFSYHLYTSKRLHVYKNFLLVYPDSWNMLDRSRQRIHRSHI